MGPLHRDWNGRRNGHPLIDMRWIDSETYLPDDILVKVDRAGMAAGLEARIPLLDREIIDYVWRLAPELCFRNGTGKWPLRQVLYRYVPREMVDRPKMGFGVNWQYSRWPVLVFQQWLRSGGV
jgi:asparagine synthetase B (glutamine-hydrolysing)